MAERPRPGTATSCTRADWDSAVPRPANRWLWNRRCPQTLWNGRRPFRRSCVPPFSPANSTQQTQPKKLNPKNSTTRFPLRGRYLSRKAPTPVPGLKPRLPLPLLTEPTSTKQPLRMPPSIPHESMRSGNCSAPAAEGFQATPLTMRTRAGRTGCLLPAIGAPGRSTARYRRSERPAAQTVRLLSTEPN